MFSDAGVGPPPFSTIQIVSERLKYVPPARVAYCTGKAIAVTLDSDETWRAQMKTPMVVFTAAILLGLTSTALATHPIGGRAHRPAIQSHTPTANALMPSTARRFAASTRQSFASEEQALFEQIGRPE